MMCQADKPHAPTTHQSTNNHVTITDEQQIGVLMESTKDAIMKSAKKKESLFKLLGFQNEILDRVSILDAVFGTNMHSFLVINIPRSKKNINSMSNEQLATSL
eukprot:11246162-Ditylum_brightwellii.AAC.1